MLLLHQNITFIQLRVTITFATVLEVCFYEPNGYTFLRQTVLHVRLPLILVRDEFGVSRPSSSPHKVHNPGWRPACLASLSDDLTLWWLVHFLALAPWDINGWARDSLLFRCSMCRSWFLPYKPDSSVKVHPIILSCLLIAYSCLLLACDTSYVLWRDNPFVQEMNHVRWRIGSVFS